MKLILFLQILTTIGLAVGQGVNLVGDDSDVLHFIAQIDRVPDRPEQQHIFLCIGTVITLTHVLTPRNVYDLQHINVTNPNQLLIRFHSNRIGDGFRATPVQIIRHNTENLVILRMGNRLDQQFQFSPRRRSELTWNRFCTFYGFDLSQVSIFSHRLVAAPAMVRNASHCASPFCVVGSERQFQACGGFLGSPILCDGSTVSAMVVNDQLCNSTHPHANLIRLQDQMQWINTNTNAASFATQSMLTVLMGIAIYLYL